MGDFTHENPTAMAMLHARAIGSVDTIDGLLELSAEAMEDGNG